MLEQEGGGPVFVLANSEASLAGPHPGTRPIRPRNDGGRAELSTTTGTYILRPRLGAGKQLRKPFPHQRPALQGGATYRPLRLGVH